MYKVFRRKVWEKTDEHGWPNGYKPLSVSMDDCPTFDNCETEKQARQCCRPLNRGWREVMGKVEAGVATADELKKYYESWRYEYHEIDPAKENWS